MALSPEQQETLKSNVFHAIAFMGGYNDDLIDLSQKLESDLGLYGYQRKALASPFLRIAKSFNRNAKIGRGQCEKLETVKEAVDLVEAASNLK